MSEADVRYSTPKAVIAFFVLAYVIAWSVFGVMMLVARQVGAEDLAAFWGLVEGVQFRELPDGLPVSPWVLYVLTRFADFAFTISGLIVVAATLGRQGLMDLGRRLVDFRFANRWYALACLPFVFYAVATVVAVSGDSAIAESVTFGPRAVWAALFSMQSGIVIHLLLRGGLGEEPGLRGFALPALQSHYGAVRASLIIGVLWGLWHLPVLIGRGPVTIVLYLVLCVLLSFVFTWLFNGSGGSLIPGLIFHTLQNSEDAFEEFVPGLVGTDWEGVSTLALIVFAAFITAGVVMRNRGKGGGGSVEVSS